MPSAQRVALGGAVRPRHSCALGRAALPALAQSQSEASPRCSSNRTIRPRLIVRPSARAAPPSAPDGCRSRRRGRRRRRRDDRAARRCRGAHDVADGARGARPSREPGEIAVGQSRGPAEFASDSNFRTRWANRLLVTRPASSQRFGQHTPVRPRERDAGERRQRGRDIGGTGRREIPARADARAEQHDRHAPVVLVTATRGSVPVPPE